MELLGIAVVSIIVGFVVGIFSGMLGIGGGTIFVPVFRLGYAMTSIASTATSLFTIIPTSVSGAVSHIRNKTCVPLLGLAMGIGGALTSPLGVWLASISPSWLIMVATACIIAYSAITMLQKAFAMPPAKNSRVKTQEKADTTDIPPVPTLTKRQVVLGICIGLIAGIAAGYAGVGGGFLLVPLAIQFIHIPMKLTSGTSLIAVMILSIPGVVYQGILGNVDWIAGIAVACGSIPGAFVGARLIRYVPERTLRFVFSVVLFVAAFVLIINQFAVLD